MTVFQPMHMPSLAGATAWLNSSPPAPSQLRGHTVLVIVRQHGPVRERTLTITFLDAGAEAYAFTFG